MDASSQGVEKSAVWGEKWITEENTIRLFVAIPKSVFHLIVDTARIESM